MKKILVLVVALAAVGCSKGDSNKSRTGNPDLDRKEEQLDQAFQKAGGHAPSQSELTKNKWCDHQVSEILKFGVDGSFEALDVGSPTFYGTYTLNGSTLAISSQGKTLTTTATVASDGRTTLLRLQIPGKASGLYENCAY